MKKTLLILILQLSVFNIVYGQNVSDLKTFIGKKFQVDTVNETLHKEYGITYLLYDPFKSADKTNIVKPLENHFSSSYDFLKGKIFDCVDVTEVPGERDRFAFKLSNKETGTVYYVFNKNDATERYRGAVNEMICIDDVQKAKELKAAAETQKIALREQPCSLITEEINEFDGTKTLSTPYDFEGKMLNSGIEKVTKKGNPTTYYLSLNTTSSTPLATTRGVIIILQNGKRINKPNEAVKTHVNSDAQYVRSSFITLTQADILLLKSSPIKKFQLYIDDDVVDEPEILYKTFLCLLTKK